jgi:hypothetical protein
MLAAFDFSGSITGAVDSLVINFEPLFKPVGDDLLISLTIIMIICYGAKMIWATSPSEYHSAVMAFKAFIVRWLVAWICMAGYDTPVFGTGLSIHQAIPAAATFLASQINTAILDTLLADIATLIKGMPSPSVLAPVEVLTFGFVFLQAMVLEGILILVSAFGFVALGVFTLLGPLLIPWLIVPPASFLFNSWLHGTIKYAMYAVIAAAQAFVFATAADQFITSSIAGDYSLHHLLGSMVGLGIITIGSVLGLLSTGSLANDLVSGSAHAGTGGLGVIGTIKSFI